LEFGLASSGSVVLHHQGNAKARDHDQQHERAQPVQPLNGLRRYRPRSKAMRIGPRSRSILFSVFAVGVICLTIGAPIVGIVSFVYDFNKSKKEFPQRHREVTYSINRIYAHFQRHGRWPTQAEITAQGMLPRGWEYFDHPDQIGPIIYRDGPHHMAISYEFEPPQQGQLNTEWTFGFEGDKRRFQADVSYSADAAP
jgi:hypothetical protein